MACLCSVVSADCLVGYQPFLPCTASSSCPLQPVQLAVQELRYGLALMAGSAATSAGSQGSQLAPVLARLMAFPRAAAAAAAATVELDSSAVQQAVADAAGAAAEARSTEAAAHSASAADAAERAKRVNYQASMAARLQLLRCSLTAAARGVEAAQLGASVGAAQASAAGVVAQQARLHAIFMGE